MKIDIIRREDGSNNVRIENTVRLQVGPAEITVESSGASLTDALMAAEQMLVDAEIQLTTIYKRRKQGVGD